MDQAQITFAIFTFVIFSLPIVGALFRLFAVRETLQAGISQNSHKLELQDQQLRHLYDQQLLFLKGLEERLEHVRDRSKSAEDLLSDRLLDVEVFIEKTTTFTRRRS